MSSITDRIKRSVRDMHGYVPGEQTNDPAVIKLNTNENPYPPSPAVMEVLRNTEASDLRRYPDPLCIELRRAIARLHKCDVRQVFVSNGSDEALALCTRAFVENDGSIGYFDPSYSLYPVLADIQGIDKSPIELGADFGWNMPDSYDASLFYIAHPNAPTSTTFARDELAGFCRDFSGVVVIDEAYVDFADRDCVDIAMNSDNVLIARTLSKSYSLAGIRLGYMLGDPDLIGALMKIKDSYNVDTLTQKIAMAAIEDNVHMRRNCERIIDTRQALTLELEKLDFLALPSQTNFIWTRHRRLEAKELFEKLRLKNILVRHFDRDCVSDYLRITIGTDPEMQKLSETLSSLVI